MNIFAAIKSSFGIVWKNLILTQPPILFLLVMSLLIGGFNRFAANSYVLMVFVASLAFLSIAFLAGWFNMVKKTIAFELDDSISSEDKAVKSFGLVKHFFPGVGEYFLPILGAILFFIVMLMISSYFSLKLGVLLFGAPDVEFFKKSLEITTAPELQLYMNSLTEEKLLSILGWFTYLFVLQTIAQFILIWWIPALYYKTKNPLVALWLNFKFLFKKFFPTVGILAFLVFLNIVISLISSVFNVNSLLSLISFLLFFFYVAYYVVLIFLYYGQNGESSAKNYINSGDDSDGEKLVSGESGEEN